jgi:hypothetical protein
MPDDYYRIPCETIGRSDWWQHVSEPPAVSPGPYWGFFPEIGNEDEGWGSVQIVYYDLDIWWDWNGDALEPQPFMWAAVNPPLVPFTARDEATARADALKAIHKPDE